MFARLAAVSTLVFAALAAAGSSGNCNTGPVQCCNSVESVRVPYASITPPALACLSLACAG